MTALSEKLSQEEMNFHIVWRDIHYISEQFLITRTVKHCLGLWNFLAWRFLFVWAGFSIFLKEAETIVFKIGSMV